MKISRLAVVKTGTDGQFIIKLYYNVNHFAKISMQEVTIQDKKETSRCFRREDGPNAGAFWRRHAARSVHEECVGFGVHVIDVAESCVLQFMEDKYALSGVRVDISDGDV